MFLKANKGVLSLMIVSLILVVGGLALTSVLMNANEKSAIQVIGLPDYYTNQSNISPLPLGENNKLSLKADLFQYPIRIGKVGPLNNNYNIPLQYPFKCGKNFFSFQQPLIDNYKGVGIPIYQLDKNNNKTNEIVGYSKDCMFPTQVSYLYNRKNTRYFFPLSEANGDIAKITLGTEIVDFIVRLETGTINRFIYAIAAIKGPLENVTLNKTLHLPDPSYWNKRLIYQFRGGVGIGKYQGNFKPNKILNTRYDQLAQGYAVAHSTGNETGNHYNIRLAEDTARRVKQQFISLYGEPLYTVGVGGSGGAVQQYLIAQNSKDILDAILPLYSYPDMVTQIIYALDCELLEYYMDVSDSDNQLWQLASNREKIIGLHASNDIEQEYLFVRRMALFLTGNFQKPYQGSTECTAAWRGLTPLINNPTYHNRESEYADLVYEFSNWTHWDDLKLFYGTDNMGYANSIWDNVGVQYGLAALKSGFISPQQFLHLNQYIGGWKSQSEHNPENLLRTAEGKIFFSTSLWSHHNMTHYNLTDNSVAPRTKGNKQAIEAIINSGHVFLGRINIPVIDIRHYLEDELDMHHISASLSTRARIKQAGGIAGNQPIWVSHKEYDPTHYAFEIIDKWMYNIRNNLFLSVAENRPPEAVDTCFENKGGVIAFGNLVWDGKWNDRKQGLCTGVYPAYMTSRMIAGEDIKGNIFKCFTISITEALDKGLYQPIDMNRWKQELERIFSDGVCDYNVTALTLKEKKWKYLVD